MADRVILVTGDPGSGKTTFLSRVIDILKGQIPTGGLLARGTWHEGRRDSFILEDLGSGSTMLFCQQQRVEGWEKIRHFYVNPDGQRFGEKVLSEESLSETLLVVIDEVGPFELQGKGWAASLDRLAAKEGIILMMSVRRSMVREVIRHWGLEGRIVFDVNGDNPEECARKILSVAHQSL